jgi:phage gp46-like protein
LLELSRKKSLEELKTLSKEYIKENLEEIFKAKLIIR